MSTLLYNYVKMGKELFREFKDNIGFDLIPRFTDSVMAYEVITVNMIAQSDHNLDYILGKIINVCCRYTNSYFCTLDNIEVFEKWNLKLMLLTDLYENKVFTLDKWNKYFKRHKVKLNGIDDVSYVPNILNQLLEGVC